MAMEFADASQPCLGLHTAALQEVQEPKHAKACCTRELRGCPKVRAQHQAGTRRQDESLVPLDTFLQTSEISCGGRGETCSPCPTV